MGIKESVFGSRSEERGFRSIEHRWGDKYNLYPGLPFAAIFEPDHTIHDTSNFFFKTSVDYTLCTKQNHPLMLIDFDGMGHGFSRDGKYVQVEKTKDPFRKVKLDFKLKFANRHGLPYYVVSYEEFQPIGALVHLTIVDGIIGHAFAKADFDKKISEVVHQHQDVMDSLPTSERDEYVQDLVIGQELLSEWEHNPIVQAGGRAWDELRNLGYKETGGGYRYLHEPELPELEYPSASSFFPGIPTMESFKARIEAMHEVMRVGCRCTLRTSMGELSETAWVRNVGQCSQAMVMAKNIAELLVYSKAVGLVKRRSG